VNIPVLPILGMNDTTRVVDMGMLVSLNYYNDIFTATAGPPQQNSFHGGGMWTEFDMEVGTRFNTIDGPTQVATGCFNVKLSSKSNPTLYSSPITSDPIYIFNSTITSDPIYISISLHLRPHLYVIPCTSGL
jgi:hypothetical protein